MYQIRLYHYGKVIKQEKFETLEALQMHLPAIPETMRRYSQ